ncbi:nucleotidyltransferase domain-containing protein [Leisingera methylohalidivorans]|uniref:Polymerase nucleotidyl transferase domain-containing protein n=1 Tax=Leisingera methylohalidivorans DSM 14336 TaxID=999552 RepID=V9W1R9_9RHOB|nr:nucleotidyltransferase domain-containing protein [Leisingera methylohalidivorans]AHD03117.1 hypothetical protein METH_12020 [Leisingera methylohalidivorans DSM 14336]
MGKKLTYLEERRSSTLEKFKELQINVADLNKILGDKACIYATGSFGRLEAGSKSDLDLFIVSKVAKDGEKTVNLLSNLDVILAKAELIRAVRNMNLPDFDGDGKYLTCHAVSDFLIHLGSPEDDYRNTLTGRLLMFLEGRAVVGEDVFNEVIEEVIAEYFRDYADHSDAFIPAFLCNDILRLWRTFCVNYEFARRKNISAQEKARIKNLKLKHSRMLTCYSAICFLLYCYKKNRTVTPQDAKEMVSLTPTDRLTHIAREANDPKLAEANDDLISRYSEFLKTTDMPDEELQHEVSENWKAWEEKSYDFGDKLNFYLKTLGEETRFFRLLVI